MTRNNNNIKTTSCSECGSRGGSLLIINVLNLSVDFSNKSSLIMFNGSVRPVFDFVDLFTTDWFITSG